MHNNSISANSNRHACMWRENEYFVCENDVCVCVCAHCVRIVGRCGLLPIQINRFFNDAISSFMFNEETDRTENARSRQNQLIWPPLRHTFQPSCVSMYHYLFIWLFYDRTTDYCRSPYHYLWGANHRHSHCVHYGLFLFWLRYYASPSRRLTCDGCVAIM